MTKNEQIKICRICGVTAPNDGIVFEKTRRVCRECRAKYQKNRREDWKDGKRDYANWYKAEQEMTNERIIKKLKKSYKGKTNVFQIPNHTLRKTDYDSAQETRYILYTFIVVCALIVYTVVKSIAEVG